jgi:Ca-activated chloride channel family protein
VNELTWMRGGLWPVLLALPLVFWLLLAGLRWVRAGTRRYGAPVGERPAPPAGRAAVLTAALGLLGLAWLEPLLGEERVTVERRGLDLVFCLDVSRSMLARDVEPDRLERARIDVGSVLPRLKGGDRAALVAFAGEAKVVAPLTHDLDSFRWLLRQADPDVVRRGGTDLGAAVRAALALIADDVARTSVIVLLTDGEDLGGAGRQAAQEAAARGVLVHAVGYGSTRGSKIPLQEDGREKFLASGQGDEVVSVMDADGLRALAAATGGEFLRADAVPLPLLELKTKRLDLLAKRSYEAGEEAQRKTRFQWVLLPAMLLLLGELWWLGGSRR